MYIYTTHTRPCIACFVQGRSSSNCDRNRKKTEIAKSFSQITKEKSLSGHHRQASSVTDSDQILSGDV